MALCKDYRVLKKRPEQVSASDEKLMSWIDEHRTSEFWDQYRSDPARYAYVRRWGCVLRRAARMRGLL